MFMLESRVEKLAALLLALLMAATRVHHFGVGAIAPDASTAVYFLAGLALASPWWLLAFLAEAVLLDVFAIGIAGVADACISGGYVLLAPAYGALWLAGRAMRKSELRKSERLDWLTAGKFVCAITGGVAAFFVIANIGYFFGSEFYALGAPEYSRRVSRYFSYYEMVTLFYSAAGIGALVLAARRSGREKLAAR
jgi:hypothetical protein